ncbi:MAG: efflux RND transporter periplasmic adaptor subunit [Pirellulales bacterium]
MRAILCGVLAVALVAIGCRPTAQPTVELRPPDVTVSQPSELEVADTYYFEGYTAAVETVDVCARVNGYLEKIYFTDGADVKKDAPLFLIDPSPYEAAYKESAAELTRADVQFKRLDADLARAQKLLPKRTITQEEFDKKAADRAAVAAEKLAREAAVEQTNLDRHFCAIKAPIAGRISRTLVTVGNLVTANVTLLTTIVSMDPMYAYFDVDEPTVLKIQKASREGKVKAGRDAKSPLELGLDIDQGYPYQGTVDFVETRVDPQTGTLKVRGVFPNKDEALSPGLHARIKISLGKPYKALAVTERAIGSNQGQKFVYVVNDKNEVVARPVKLGPLHDGMRVIAEGLKADDRVIVNGMQRVRPGVTVDPKSVETATAASKPAARQPAGG